MFRTSLSIAALSALLLAQPHVATAQTKPGSPSQPAWPSGDGVRGVPTPLNLRIAQKVHSRVW